MATKSRKKSIWKKPSFYFMGILMILSICLIIQLFLIQILPIKYSIIISVIVLLLNGLMWLLQFNKHINKANRTLGKIFILVLSIGLAIGNFYVYKGGETLRGISSANIKTDAISVIVKKDSKSEKIADLKGKSFGILSTLDLDNTNKAIEDVEKSLNESITTKKYNNLFDLAKALYEGDVDTILMNEAYRGSFQDNTENVDFKDFDSDTKIVYQVELHSEMTDISKNVDVTTKPFNVFISGIDTFGPVSASSRSDVNMLATINPNTHQILLTSIPRDYYVSQTCQGGQLDKLTHAGIFGVDCSVNSIENLFTIDINYYVRVNFSSLINIIDALGGITVDNPTAFTASDNTYSYEAGLINMDGAKALRFSRERYAFVDGDRERGKNQMRVINGIVDKAISPSIITNFTSVMNAVDGSFETNMSSSDITKFVQKQLNTMSGWTVVQNSVNGTGGTDWTPANGFNAYVMYPDQATVDYAKTLINQVLSGTIVSN